MNWLSLLGLEAFVLRWRAAAIEGAIAAEDRLELARLEWQQEKQRLQLLLVLAVAGVGLTVVALVMVSMAILVHFWDTPDRTLVGWLVAGAWCALWFAIMLTLALVMRRASNAFALTRHELALDWREIKERL